MFVGMFITAALPLLQACCSAFAEFPATWMAAKKEKKLAAGGRATSCS